MKLAFVLECLGEFSSLFEKREEEFGRIEEIINE